MKMTTLPEAHRVFVRTLVETGSRSAAAKASGCDAGILLNPRVALAARDLLLSRILSLAPLAIKVLTGLMTDEKVPAAVRRLAASDLLDRAGLTAAPANVLESKEQLADMPPRALRDLVARLENELFARSTPVLELEVNAAPAATDPANPLAFLG